MWNLIVAGAGPAGTIAATVAARGGARVLLIDRARFPRDKLCGLFDQRVINDAASRRQGEAAGWTAA